MVPNTYHFRAEFGVGYTSLIKDAGSCLIIVLSVKFVSVFHKSRCSVVLKHFPGLVLPARWKNPLHV